MSVRDRLHAAVTLAVAGSHDYGLTDAILAADPDIAADIEAGERLRHISAPDPDFIEHINAIRATYDLSPLPAAPSLWNYPAMGVTSETSMPEPHPWPEVWPVPIKECGLCSPPWWGRWFKGGVRLLGKDHPPTAHNDWNGA